MTAWYQDDYIGNFGYYPDPVATYPKYPKPDLNFINGTGKDITALLSGRVTGVRKQPWGPLAWSITIQNDTPPNSIATHSAYNYVSNPVVSVGQHVSVGQKLAVSGNPYNIGTAFAFTDATIYGQATANEPFSGTWINPQLNPEPFILAIRKNGLSTGGSTPLIVRAFCDEIIRNLRGDNNSPQEIVNFLISWCHHEGGSVTNACHFNCLNTMQDEPGATQCAGAMPGIKSYANGSDGIKATVDALSNGNYPSLKNAIATGDVINLGMQNRGAPSFSPAMAANVAGDLSVWVSGKRSPLREDYIIPILQGAGVTGATIQGGKSSGGNGNSQSTIDAWGNAVIGEDTTGVTVGGATKNILGDLSGVNNFFSMIGGFFSNPVRIVKIILGGIALVTGLALLVRAFIPQVGKVLA